MRRLGKVLGWLGMALVSALSPMAFAQERHATAAPLRVAVIANDFVLPGKTARLSAWGRDKGVVFRHVAIERADGEASQWLRDTDLAILDTPRPSDAAQVREALGDALDRAKVPWVQVGGGAPRFGVLHGNTARRLIGYYAAGGEANFRAMIDHLAAWRSNADASSIPPPQALASTGFHHPWAPGAFADAGQYLHWRAGRGIAADAPTVAMLIAPGAIASMQTAVVDAAIERSQAHGVNAVGVWFDAGDPHGLENALRGLRIDAIVNFTHLQDGEARRAEFERLGVPVLQTLNHRQGPPEAWRAAPQGVAMPLVATFLAVPEGWGMSDPLVLGAVERGEPVPIAEQVDALASKLARLSALRRKPAAHKSLALMFWNYPAGEKNLSASHLNVPRSLERLTHELARAGYRVRPADEARLIADAQAMLGGLYRPETLDELLRRDLAAPFPVSRYRQWLQTLPAQRRDALLARWGAPEEHPAVRDIDGEPMFVIPRMQLDRLIVMPQPPRAGRIGEATHDQASLPGHYYLAAYLFVREGFRADALIHFGTHGTQEWTPGKDRGLWINDFPFLTLGDLPVFYPYIQDNVGEAVQAKRRGRAVTISHQTPAFAPAGLYDELRDLHALVHEYQQLEDGGVRTRTQQAILDAARVAGMMDDMGWQADAARADFAGFFDALHDHLHELARSAMPLGLHTFGGPAAPAHRLATVMQQLGEPYYRALGLDPDEVFAGDFNQLETSPAYRVLHRHLREGVPLDEVRDDALRGLLRRAKDLDAALADTQEIESLLMGLAGGFVRPGAGGDPVRNPDVRGGRNLFPFEPDRIPTKAAYDAGGEALEQLLAAYREEHGGRTPEKLAFSLWSSEAIRHLGVLESQVLHALGLRPVWNEGGRVTALEIVPDAGLRRPRIDAVVQVTSVYRDQFDGFMRMLAQAIDRLAAQDDAKTNPVARNSDAVERALIERGVDAARARQLARLRLFGNAPGEYGSALPDAVLAEGGDKDDATLARGFLQRLQYGYGAGEWGTSLEPGQGNLFAEQLRGVQAAVLARSSNLHGMLSTDHPFEYLGGLSLAVRHLDGASPALYVSDLRGQRPRTSSAKGFLAAELRSRQLNPQWIRAMQQEGYAGTLQVLDTVNNLFGWQLADPSMVRDAQWQAIHDTYVRDTRRLGIDAWFERANPTAQRQMIARMREAIERGHWHADARTRAELRQRMRELDARTHPPRDSVARVGAGSGFGLAVDVPTMANDASGESASTSASTADAVAPPSPTPAPPQVRGRVLREVGEAEPVVADRWHSWLGLALLASCLGLGAWRQRRPIHVSIPPEPSR